MTDLNTLLNANTAPNVRQDVSARILASAQTAQPANDTISPRRWWSVGSVVAMALMAAIFIIQPTSDPSSEWEQIADGSGFSDLYEWVEGDTLVQ